MEHNHKTEQAGSSREPRPRDEASVHRDADDSDSDFDEQVVRYRNLDMSTFHFRPWTWAVAAITWAVDEPGWAVAWAVAWAEDDGLGFSKGFFGANSWPPSGRAAPPNFTERHKFNL
jgi:hypothetical protein